MASGSKRKRLNTLIPSPDSTKKSKNAGSSGAPDDTQTPSQIAGPSTIITGSAAYADQSWSSTSGRTTTIATPGSTAQVPVLFESSSQVNHLPIPISGAPYNARAPSVGAHFSDVVPGLSLEEWASGIGTPNNAMPEYTSQVPALVESSYQAAQILVGSGGGILNRASHFSLDMRNGVMMDNSNNVTVNIGSDQQAQAIKLLFEHTIRGSAHDSSARSPPPRCHQETRVKINKDLITFFNNKDTQELLVWVYGHAGVGKSAIMQTLADELVKSLHLGASVFISRSKGRNSSRQLLLTVGYQFAEHIKDYRTYITEKLDQNPGLVDKGMEEQFKIFIVEPFGARKIGASAKPWAVLLDGLDELDEHESQTEIIRLVTNFVLEHPDAPLRWAIASRPEPHIVDKFDGEDITRARWKMHVPVDHAGVTYFLKDNLERIRKNFPRTVPKEWPSKEQFWELVYRASGLFILANTVIRFIENPRYADPVTRLNQVLSALDGAAATSHAHPLAALDALYAGILSLIPPDVWLTTKRVLGALLYKGTQPFNELGEISVVLGLDLSTVYASVNGCYSFMELSDPEDAYWRPTNFYHASFGDYLLDPARSQNFCISMGDVEEDIFKSALNVWQRFKANHSLTPGLTYAKRWVEYLLSSGVPEWHARHFRYYLMSRIHRTLVRFLVEKHDPRGVPFSSKEDQDQCFDLLDDVVDILSGAQDLGHVQPVDFWPWLFDLCEVYQDELVSRGTILAGTLETIKPLQAGPRSAYMQFIASDKTQNMSIHEYDWHKSHQVIDQISHLKLHSPKLPVLFLGSPGNHHLLLRHKVDAVDPHFHQEIPPPLFRYLYVPHSDFNSYHEAEHFLKTGFEAIQRKYSPLLPPSWPSQEQVAKLAGAVAHHLPFAHIALQFIQDPYFANPVTHLDQLLALIDGVDPTDDQLFIYVDALYTHILNSIPSDMWPATQQVLSALLYKTTILCYSFSYPHSISHFFGLDLERVYALLDCCHLFVFLGQDGNGSDTVDLCHASFCQYLMDATRSKKFYVSIDSLLRKLYDMWLDFAVQFPGIYAWERWYKYRKSRPRANSIKVEDIHEALVLFTQYEPAELEAKEIQDQVFHALGKLDFEGVSMVRWNRPRFAIWLFAMWKIHRAELTSRGLFHAIEFQKLPVDCPLGEHILDIYFHTLSRCVDNEMKVVVGKRPSRFGQKLEVEEYISGLRLFQQHRPQLQVLIGGIPGARFAIFEYEYTEGDLEVKHDSGLWKLELGDRGYYVLSCPDDV